MTYPPLALSGTMQRAAVHGVFQMLRGQALRPADLSTGWYDRDRDETLSEREVTEAFGFDRMALSLRQPAGIPAVFPSPDAAAERAAMWMDAADGRQDGTIDFDRTPYQPNPSWPEHRLPTAEVARNLASGEWVIGTQLMSRRDAIAHGLTLTEIQDGSQAWPQPSTGPVLARVYN